MEQISGLLFGLCFAAALGAVVRLLSPGSSTARLLRLCTALFVLLSAVRPIHEALLALSVPSDVQAAQTASDAVLDTARRAIEQTARNTLDAHGCAQAAVQVEMQIRNGEVHAAVFRITGVSEREAQEIEDELFALTGERPCVESAAP